MAVAVGPRMTNHNFVELDGICLEHVTGGAGDSYNSNWGNLMQSCANSKGASSPSKLSGKDWSACSNWAHPIAGGKDPTQK
jgi:hypothetical protein